jgi:hypothetical protein
MPVNRFHGLPGAPPKASNRRLKPRVLSAQRFSPGDAVAWNDRYRGTVKAVYPDGSALIEDDGAILGSPRQWHLDLAALTLVVR